MEGDTYGLLYGAQLFYKRKKYLLGLDYMASTFTYKHKFSDSSTVDDAYEASLSGSTSSYSILAGVLTFKNNFFMYLGYTPNLAMKLEKNLEATEKAQDLKGTAIKVGAAITFLKGFKLHFEYVKGTFNELTQGSATVSLPGTPETLTYKEHEFNQYLFFISYPFGMGRRRR